LHLLSSHLSFSFPSFLFTLPSIFLHYVLQYIYLPFYVSLPSFPFLIPSFYLLSSLPGFLLITLSLTFISSISVLKHAKVAGLRITFATVRDASQCQMQDGQCVAQLVCSSEGKTIKIKKRTDGITRVATTGNSRVNISYSERF
jgi:hypothetical protein